MPSLSTAFCAFESFLVPKIGCRKFTRDTIEKNNISFLGYAK